MLRHNRAYRIFRASLAIFVIALRYLFLSLRRKLPLVAPSARSWDRAHARTGRQIYRLTSRLGGVFVKVGQVLGARADVFPESFVAPLRRLHDKMPPRPFSKLRGYVEEQLGRPIEEVFEQVDEKPLAAASLAQVHRARLLSGDDVVLKIQYPEARRLLPVDLRSLRRAVPVVRRLSGGLDLRSLADEIEEFVGLELDFVREADSTERVRSAFPENGAVRIPRVYRECSNQRLLVLEYIDGTPIADVDRWRANDIEPRRVAEQLAELYCTMIFEHGFFHGDPHPGNILVLRDGAVALLDFGLAKELPAGFSSGVATMFVKGMAGDAAGAAQAARSIGFEISADDAGEFLQVIRMMLGDYGGPDRALDLLKSGALEHVPAHFTLIVRALVLLNGLSHMLVPGERIIAIAMARAMLPHVAEQAAAPPPRRTCSSAILPPACESTKLVRFSSP